MAKIKVHIPNLVRESGQTNSSRITCATEDSDYPLTRIYDGHLKRLFKTTADTSHIIYINNSYTAAGGASYYGNITDLIIPEGHSLGDGDGLIWSSAEIATASSKLGSYTAAYSWNPDATTTTIHKTFTSAGNNWIRVTFTRGSSGTLSLPELILTTPIEIGRDPDQFDRGVYPVFNVERLMDSSGTPRFIEFGDSKRYREYVFTLLYGSDRTNVESLNTYWAGKNPFYIVDTDGELIYGELVDPIQFQRSGDHTTFNFNFLEII